MHAYVRPCTLPLGHGLQGWYAAMQDYSRRYGPTFKLFVGALPHVVTTDVHVAKKISRLVARPTIGIPTMTTGRDREFEGYQLIFTE